MPDRNFARGPHGELQRPAFAEGEPFTACDLNLKQSLPLAACSSSSAFCARLGRSLRFTRGGHLPDPALPWLIRVCPGYGISPCGDELVVPSAATEGPA